MIITPQHVHARNWMKCPQCEGRPRTEREIRLGYLCIQCDNKGEIPRRQPKVYADNSSYYERLAGA